MQPREKKNKEKKEKGVVRPIGEEGIDPAAERGALCISRERKGRRSDVIRRYQVGIRSSGSDVTEWWEGARAQSPRSLLQILREKVHRVGSLRRLAAV